MKDDRAFRQKDFGYGEKLRKPPRYHDSSLKVRNNFERGDGFGRVERILLWRCGFVEYYMPPRALKFTALKRETV